ncbi:hypothetical protein PN498_20020 [Oscillatoria sp. CS-180]|uniref:hypothetical protein n=1 Tax=Oscillatoria sp. CS-180 TaxID=3021720 RepID=UPI0023313374|nr:hypothetical protein [Oscillatoria sp. CS-180]MDB9528290.1 hypothetical protein [Oscillatoria sp. CS-180]
MGFRSHQSSLEHRRVLTLAREYRSEGYDVTVYPEAADLPDTLSKCPLDLVARTDDQVIAVEVRTRQSLTRNGSEDLRRMAAKITEIPGWQFELVVTNPRNPKEPEISTTP